MKYGTREIIKCGELVDKKMGENDQREEDWSRVWIDVRVNEKGRGVGLLIRVENWYSMTERRAVVIAQKSGSQENLF